MENGRTMGHLAALFTVFIWGTTFISTKVLLADFQPVEILIFRFVMGWALLLALCPRRLRLDDRRQELTFAAAGLCGICLYYLLENIALTYTMASNVGVITSTAPFFTAILAHLLMKSEGRLSLRFVLGFAVAMAGIALISFNGQMLRLNPLGDMLALLAELMWAAYSLLMRRISAFGYPVLQVTRRIFFWGLVFMLPTAGFFDFQLNLARFADIGNLLNILYLGLGASAICFLTWNFAVKELSAVKTTVYMYLMPVITVVTSMIVLHEPLTVLAAVGTALTLLGLILSEGRGKKAA